MRKNQSGQTFLVFAFDKTTNEPVLNDEANITCRIRKDYGSGAATNDVNPDEIEDGFYEFIATQAESNADVIDVLPQSSTANVQVIGVPARIFTDQLDSIYTKTQLISSGLLSVVSPITRSGAITIVQGDDYDNDDGRAIDFVNEDGDWPDLTGATVSFIADNAVASTGADFSASMSVVTPTGENQTVRLELTDTQTGTLDLDKFDYSVKATLSNNNVVTLQRMSQGLLVVASP
jgi:hypothetical protein